MSEAELASQTLSPEAIEAMAIDTSPLKIIKKEKGAKDEEEKDIEKEKVDGTGI